MIYCLAAENFNQQIVTGVLGQSTVCNIVRVQDVGLRAATDPLILAWAAEENRILLTDGVETMTSFADQLTLALGINSLFGANFLIH
ncbi:DUF5615 family PIN-like protein [Thermosynechococcaceae cyanobacterium BACA0444]|uniref:DUF5615 family PIN-like protein n=1 Tax=Pseudocalidococcus azoricus BACA0444 TaxID=2918990 RepID=A0AAE4JVM1_9CYAN|nr:DUF5615 family PIN-like protein [Pseudocalidococcus azoricus]MDS3860201.1 DUF5615 family PIN-like protein [Pseudocalidococcus azoricus BACA0444]